MRVKAKKMAQGLLRTRVQIPTATKQVLHIPVNAALRTAEAHRLLAKP